MRADQRERVPLRFLGRGFRGLVRDDQPPGTSSSVEHAPTVMTLAKGLESHMANIAKKLDSDNVADRPREIVIHGPRTEWGRDSHSHPWSAALIAELVQNGWNILHGDDGRIEAMHRAFMCDA